MPGLRPGRGLRGLLHGRDGPSGPGERRRLRDAGLALACFLLTLLGGCGDPQPPLQRDRVGAPAAAQAAQASLESLGLSALRPEPNVGWPVQSVHITSYFGWRTDPVSGVGVRVHKGVDFRGGVGDFALAVADGRVSFVGHDVLLGNLVIVDHGEGVHSYYAHLSDLLVHVGVVVARGAAVGLIGNTGRSAAPHLHLTIKVDDVAIDPLVMIGQPLRRPDAIIAPLPDTAGPQ